ncbi:ABC transporter substrate-binding protein [Glutamicibacter sp. MNS18]|uniref:ABC transporter substrate-binding protein n=1 Tax=Glutamicibacter sp. MNS18 TaxID=2989817 RepID=UPI002235CE16|nr:ABC transporter substrate-binding protein [Glutamicibacter sp. MNS18]MCW4465589.1 ABC transporter substrate-binding protein [Glutamicibacter sp. MNS18]
MKIRTLTAVLTSLALGMTLSACSGDAPDPQSADSNSLTQLNVGTVGIGSDAAITTAIEQGFFAEEGLAVTTSVVANPPAGISAAQSGQLDLTYTPSIPLINALSQNVGLRVIAAADGYSADALENAEPEKVDDTGLFVQPDSAITSPKDLAGKTVAVPARKAQIEVTVASMVLEDGGDPDTINWMVLDPASSLQSLQQGRVDAAGLVAPFTSNAMAQGMDLLGSPGLEFFGPGAVGLWVSGAQLADAEPEVMEAFQRAIYRANAYANENLDEMDELAAQITGVDIETIRQGAESYWPASVELADLTQVDAQLVELGYLPQEVGIDESIIFSAR